MRLLTGIVVLSLSLGTVALAAEAPALAPSVLSWTPKQQAWGYRHMEDAFPVKVISRGTTVRELPKAAQEINPTWTVPYSIATGEMLPKLRRNPSAYSAEFEVFMNGKLTSWSGINWNAYGKGNFPFTFRQKPGPKNALGKVKFMLPNPYNIYLHDTPAKDKFLATTRAFSHGCVRVQNPRQFAAVLLGWDEAVQAAVL